MSGFERRIGLVFKLMAVFLTVGHAGAQSDLVKQCESTESNAQIRLCKAKSVNGTECPDRPSFRLDKVWQDVASESEAISVVRRQYALQANFFAFSTWLKCQGFEVYAEPSQRADEGLFLMATFNRNVLQPFPLSNFDVYGWIGLKNSQAFHIEIDRFGAVTNVSVHESY